MQLLTFALLALAIHCFLVAGTPTTNAFIEMDQLTVFTSSVKIHRTASHILRIHGSNFPQADTLSTISLRFEPPLVQGLDFTTLAANGDGVNVVLLGNRAWRTEPGSLLLRSVDLISELGVPTRYPAFGDGIQVAEVVEDPATGRDHNKLDDPVFLKPSDLRVYQSALLQSITLTGTGFQADLELVLDPYLEPNEDYSLTVTSSTSAVLSLLPGKKWRFEPGFLSVRNIKSGNADYAPNLIDGIRIAEVFADPEVFYKAYEISEDAGVEYFKVITLDSNKVTDIKLALNPAVTGTLRIEAVFDDAMLVEVHREARVKDTTGKNLFTIDTGAGRVPLVADMYLNTFANDDRNDDYPFGPEAPLELLELSSSELFQDFYTVRRALQQSVASHAIAVPVVPIIVLVLCLAVWRTLYTRKRASPTSMETLAYAELV